MLLLHLVTGVIDYLVCLDVYIISSPDEQQATKFEITW